MYPLPSNCVSQGLLGHATQPFHLWNMQQYVDTESTEHITITRDNIIHTIRQD